MTRWLWLALVAALGCNGAYDVTFVCDPGGPECPRDEECPEVPLGSGGCEELPGLFGHDPAPVDVGRPVGCTVALSYGNPSYANEQQTCTCDVKVGVARWGCPL